MWSILYRNTIIVTTSNKYHFCEWQWKPGAYGSQRYGSWCGDVCTATSQTPLLYYEQTNTNTIYTALSEWLFLSCGGGGAKLKLQKWKPREGGCVPNQTILRKKLGGLFLCACYTPCYEETNQNKLTPHTHHTMSILWWGDKQNNLPPLYTIPWGYCDEGTSRNNLPPLYTIPWGYCEEETCRNNLPPSLIPYNEDIVMRGQAGTTSLPYTIQWGYCDEETSRTSLPYTIQWGYCDEETSRNNLPPLYHTMRILWRGDKQEQPPSLIHHTMRIFWWGDQQKRPSPTHHTKVT